MVERDYSGSFQGMDFERVTDAVKAYLNDQMSEDPHSHFSSEGGVSSAEYDLHTVCGHVRGSTVVFYAEENPYASGGEPEVRYSVKVWGPTQGDVLSDLEAAVLAFAQADEE